MDLVLLNPPHNVRNNHSDTNVEHDKFASADIKNSISLRSPAMKPGAHGYVSCSADQFVVWKATVTRFRSSVHGPSTPDANQGTNVLVRIGGL